MSDRKIHWRCFHCNATFTKAQERWACEHFGSDQEDRPVCQMRLPGEHHLLTVLRSQERELRRYRAEDTGLIRAIYSMRGDHATALREEEQRGYDKGLADGRALSADDASMRQDEAVQSNGTPTFPPQKDQEHG